MLLFFVGNLILHERVSGRTSSNSWLAVAEAVLCAESAEEKRRKIVIVVRLLMKELDLSPRGVCPQACPCWVILDMRPLLITGPLVLKRRAYYADITSRL